MKLQWGYLKPIEFTNPLEGSVFEKLKRSLLTLMIRQKDILFQQSTDPAGSPWKPLSQLVADTKNAKSKLSAEEISEKQKTNPNFKMHKILIDTGALKNSMTATSAPYSVRSTAGNVVEIGTNIPYARIQNYGGKIKSRSGAEIVIPARPFIGISDRDDTQIQEKIEATVRKISVKK